MLNVSEKCWVFSLITGQVYKLDVDEVKKLYSYQIPFKKAPKSNCKKCYGRGYEAFDTKNQVYAPCKCVTNNLIDGFDARQITVYMPRLA